MLYKILTRYRCLLSKLNNLLYIIHIIHIKEIRLLSFQPFCVIQMSSQSWNHCIILQTICIWHLPITKFGERDSIKLKVLQDVSYVSKFGGVTSIKNSYFCIGAKSLKYLKSFLEYFPSSNIYINTVHKSPPFHTEESPQHYNFSWLLTKIFNVKNI